MQHVLLSKTVDVVCIVTHSIHGTNTGRVLSDILILQRAALKVRHWFPNSVVISLSSEECSLPQKSYALKFTCTPLLLPALHVFHLLGLGSRPPERWNRTLHGNISTEVCATSVTVP